MKRVLKDNQVKKVLFRGKGVDESDKDRWYYGYYYCAHDTTHCCAECTPEETHHYILFEQITDWDLPNKLLRADIDINTLGQYALTSIKGKQVFEGDLVKHPFGEEIGVVRFGEYSQPFSPDLFTTHIGFYVDWVSGSEKTYLRKDLFYWANLEVDDEVFIGNIYDNPELLKQ